MKSLVGLLVCAIFLTTGALKGQAQDLRTVALTGQQAPGTSVDVVFQWLEAVWLNNSGDVAFTALLDGPNVNSLNNNGIWSESAGMLDLVVRTGEPAPGTTRIFRDIRWTGFNDSGESIFSADLLNDSRFGIWSEGFGALQLVALEDDPAPGTSGLTFSTIGIINTTMSPSGQSLFAATLSNNAGNGVWFQDQSGAVQLFYRAGDLAPGTTDVFDSVGKGPLLSMDRTVFRGVLDTAFGIDTGIWYGDKTNLQLLVREGNPAPGTSHVFRDSIFASAFNLPKANNAGQMFFQGGVDGSGVNFTNAHGIWYWDGGPLQHLALASEQAPGLPTGVRYQFFGDLLINDHGKISFVSTLQGIGVNDDNKSSVWVGDFGAVDLLLREADQAPGTPAGVVFFGTGAFDGINVFDNFILNSSGQLAFTGKLGGTGVDETNDFGIWAQNRFGQVCLIAREADAIEVAPGDFRTIEYLFLRGLSANNGGIHSGFNNLGQLAFLARFTDGSHGIFVSNKVALPLPTNPEGRKLPDGLVVAGQLSDLFVSDDQYFELDPSPTKNPLKQKIHLILQSTSPIDLPSEMEFRLEAAMTGGPSGDVVQQVELFNYLTSRLEQIDVRPAANFDDVIALSITGDPSRFVNPLNREITAEITWTSAKFGGAPFTWSVDVDQAVWIID